MQRKIGRRRFMKLGGRAAVLGLVASYPVFVERYIVLMNTYRIPVPNLPPAFTGFRIVHLTDLHYGALVPLTALRHVTGRTNRIKHDLTVCTGDYVHARDTTRGIDAV